MDSLKFLHGFVKVVKYISRPLPNGIKMKFDLDFDFFDWLKELNKFERLNAFGPLCLCQCFCNVHKRFDVCFLRSVGLNSE